jgi:hypothetical protein
VAEEQGWLSKLGEYIQETVAERFDIGTIAKEVVDMGVQKTAQGAAEISQAHNIDADSYVPYGAAQAPLEVEGPTMSYQDMLRDAAQSADHEPDRGIDR